YSGSRDVLLLTFATATGNSYQPKIFDNLAGAGDTTPGYRWVETWRGRSTTLENTSICKYGVSTGYTCGVIETVTWKPSYVPNALGTFIRTKLATKVIVLSGDSGGPVFSGGTAYGIVSGSGDSGKRMIIMSVSYLPDGWVVMTK